MAYTVPSRAIWAASTATDPLPAPMSHTTLAGPMSISARAMARISAGVSRPRLGFDCRNVSSGLPNRRRPIVSAGRSGTCGLRTRIMTLSGANSWAAISSSSPLRHAARLGDLQVLAHIHGEVIDLVIQEHARDSLRRNVFLVNKPTFSALRTFSKMLSRLREARFVEHRVFPTFHDAGKSRLHRAHVGKDLEAFLSQAVEQVVRHAVEQGIPHGEQHCAFAARGFDGMHGLLQRDSQDHAVGAAGGYAGQQVFLAEEPLRLLQGLPRTER